MENNVEAYMAYLEREEKSIATRQQYKRDILCFLRFADGGNLTKELILSYKEMLRGINCPTTVNTKLAALNGFFSFVGREDLRLKRLRVQKRPFCSKEKELTKAEYLRLLEAAKHRKNERLCLVLETICGTGIRVSELQYITADAVRQGEAVITLKGKTRVILITGKLKKTSRDEQIKVLIREYVRLSEKIDQMEKKMESQNHEVEQKKQAEESAEEEKEKAYPSRVVRNMESRSKSRGHSKEAQRPSKKNKAWKIIGEVVFYGLLVLLILSALFIRTAGDGAPKSLAGYSGMIVLTESMQSEIPKGSLVIAKQVDGNTLEIGDDITYMANQTTSVTHRIVGIVENYENTGERAFETQGVMNDRPDNQLVPAVNVVGKVVFHSEVLGTIAGFIGDYWPALLIVLAVGIVLVNVLGRIFRKDKEEKPLPETTNHDV